MLLAPATVHQPIADLHCDLLCYLSRHATHTPYDLAVRCAIPQLHEGFVKIQTMAIFTETMPGSAKSGFAQAEIFKNLPQHYPGIFELLRRSEQIELLPHSKAIGILPAIENASSFCEESDDLESALKQLTSWQRKIGKLVYMSLTWNTGKPLRRRGIHVDRPKKRRQAPHRLSIRNRHCPRLQPHLRSSGL